MRNDQCVADFYAELLLAFRDGKGVAYRHYDEKHSYGELYELMMRFNAVLKGYRGKRIVLHGSKRFPTYAAIYATILSGNIWIPLSLDNPEARNKALLEVAEPDLVLHEGELPDALAAHFEQAAIPMVSFSQAMSLGGRPFEEGEFNGDDWAYIMFTSGSTGVPKGVPMTHSNYINFVRNIMDTLPFGEGEVFSDFHDFAFDISIFYLFAAPLAGGCLSPIIKQQDRMLPLDHILKNNVTVWSSVPSAINLLKRFRPKARLETPIRIMFLCGEPLKLEVLGYCFDNMGLKSVYNFYGLTETGVENFFHKCLPTDPETYANYGMAPIGKPLPGNHVRVLDSKELLIGGCQITPGYLGGRSPERFMEDGGIRWIKTGDVVEQVDDVLFCKGRVDSQVKLGGHRVELSDIEAHIVKAPTVEEVVCFVNPQTDSVVAAIKPKEGFDFQELVTALKKDLPGYMIPRYHMGLDSIPLNSNGKVDKLKLKKLFAQQRA